MWDFRQFGITAGSYINTAGTGCPTPTPTNLRLQNPAFTGGCATSSPVVPEVKMNTNGFMLSPFGVCPEETYYVNHQAPSIMELVATGNAAVIRSLVIADYFADPPFTLRFAGPGGLQIDVTVDSDIPDGTHLNLPQPLELPAEATGYSMEFAYAAGFQQGSYVFISFLHEAAGPPPSPLPPSPPPPSPPPPSPPPPSPSIATYLQGGLGLQGGESAAVFYGIHTLSSTDSFFGVGGVCMLPERFHSVLHVAGNELPPGWQESVSQVRFSAAKASAHAWAGLLRSCLAVWPYPASSLAPAPRLTPLCGLFLSLNCRSCAGSRAMCPATSWSTAAPATAAPATNAAARCSSWRRWRLPRARCSRRASPTSSSRYMRQRTSFQPSRPT